MIALLRGVVASRDDNVVVVDVGGVGYEVHVSSTTVAGLAPGSETRLHIHTAVREDAIQLFGFTTISERDVFLRLNTVTGIGPKLAMAVLSGAPLDELIAAVVGGDLRRLTQISGVGKKTAERIVLELKEPFRALAKDVPATVTKSTDGSLADVKSALTNLGFKGAVLDRALEQLEMMKDRPRQFDALLREALKLLR